jgi:hypothetical protein
MICLSVSAGDWPHGPQRPDGMVEPRHEPAAAGEVVFAEEHTMVQATLAPIPLYSSAAAPRRRTHRQRARQQRSRRLKLQIAVRHAVDVFFRFTQRDSHSKSLWSETERVWMGRSTFLDWAVRDPEIDIPWVVAGAADAPAGADEFQEAVCSELKAYWTIQSARLPNEKKPRWLPLP